MGILPQSAAIVPRQVPTWVRGVKLVLRVALLAFGAYAIQRAEKQRIMDEAAWKVEIAAYRKKLDDELQEYIERSQRDLDEATKSLQYIESFAMSASQRSPN